MLIRGEFKQFGDDRAPHLPKMPENSGNLLHTLVLLKIVTPSRRMGELRDRPPAIQTLRPRPFANLLHGDIEPSGGCTFVAPRVHTGDVILVCISAYGSRIGVGSSRNRRAEQSERSDPVRRSIDAVSGHRIRRLRRRFPVQDDLDFRRLPCSGQANGGWGSVAHQR